ncbi:bacterial regulatory protein, lacI family protein [Asticcacaulis biprosthecium C19]|uniref:Bacterial regulatory protein, lacI family protein n=1 Tax=Asticcacaulis biprosthecium C19 TaxID=715226 RepID=F4QTJ6_9CAUL|nr:LacI family DNA-binding transcriptional regulator [Asticcacaulis biprosthecium]EGF90066.1 bacterial regulatory protein, lacI family protein [Asticcacaulis biprosthecium C19]
MKLDRRNLKLDDVAARAGVSASTVSRYINKPSVVAEDTAQRIQSAIDAIGYVPNLVAGGLATQKSDLVAVLIPHLTSTVFSDTIEAMVNELSASQHVVMLGVTGLQLERTRELVMAALSRRAAAIILTSEVTPDLRDLLRKSNTSVIEIWDLPTEPIDIAIGFSHEAIGEEIARFLHLRGYCRPHLVTSNASRARRRRDGLVKTWAELGGVAPTEDIIELPVKFGQARGVFARMKRLEARPDVVVCGTDLLAQGLIIEAMSQGLKVPDDLAVVGFGNATVAGEMRPTITSVDIDGKRIAREAIAMLRRRAEGEVLTSSLVDVGFSLVARESA